MGGDPKLSAADARTQRQRDQELARERLKKARSEDARRKHRLGYSLMVGPGGERGVQKQTLGVGV